MNHRSAFLTARWKHLAMLNYEIEPAILAPHIPPDTELDTWNGKTLMSVVGFMFLDTKVLGVPVPFHRDFEEVNLRFYVRRKGPEGWRRGVAFIKEIVPKFAIAAVARGVYNEPYQAMPMRHTLDLNKRGISRVEYGWQHLKRWNRLCVHTIGGAAIPNPDSEEAFITEHYWGYREQRHGTTLEYHVEHPPWKVWQVSEAQFDGDTAALYGEAFEEALSGEPSSAFLADGSGVTVYQGEKI